MNLPQIKMGIAAAMIASLFAAAAPAAPAAPRGELVRISAPADEVVWREAPRPYYGEIEYQQQSRPGMIRLTEFEESQIIPAPQDGDIATYGGGGKKCGSGCCLTMVGGVESTFLFPILDDAPADVIVEDSFARTHYSSSSVELDDDIFFSPRIWAGLECCGWGVIGRLWWLGDSDTNLTPATPFYLQNSTEKARLQAYTVDFEVYKRWCNCYGDDRQFAIGFRYANWEASDLAEAHGEASDDFFQVLAQTNREFDGPGLTLAYQGTKCCDCCACVKLFFNLRGSVLWGNTLTQAQTTAWVFDPDLGGVANDFSTATAYSDDIAFIGEVQVGGQWEHQLACSCARVYLRAAFEYQYWSADSGFAAAGSNAFTDDIDVTALATADDFQMNLVGFTIGTGLIW